MGQKYEAWVDIVIQIRIHPQVRATHRRLMLVRGKCEGFLLMLPLWLVGKRKFFLTSPLPLSKREGSADS